jgi:transglutaminase-like putative cysteine protease
MSLPADNPSRLVRLVELTPVLAALTLHAVAHERWLLCAPLMVALVAATLAGVRLDYNPTRLLLAGVFGLGAGVAMLWVSVPPTAPFPPTVFGPVCGMLVGLSAFCALGRSRYYAWTYACLLVVLSMRVRSLPAMEWVLGAVVLSMLLVAFVEGGLPRSGLWGGVGFLAFLGVLAGGALGLGRLVHAGEGVLMDAMYQLTSGPGSGRGIEYQSGVGIGPVSRTRRGSDRALMVLSGPRTERVRTRVYDAFDGEQWTTSEALANARPALPSEQGVGRELEVTVLARLGSWLPAPAGTRGVDGVRPEVVGGWLLKANGLEGMTFALRTEARDVLPPEAAPGEALTALPAELEAELLPLAEELTRQARTPREKAQALESHFQSRFLYSLEVNLHGEGSPLAVLVRERRAAYCTYFASAMAALLRTLDVPARVVGGFAPEERNALTGATLVRERDAHAWVEVYLADEGRFVAFDPTPWQSRDEALGLSGERSGFLGNLVEAVGTTLRRVGAALRYQPLEQLQAVGSSPVFWALVVAGGLWRWRGQRRGGRARARRAALDTRDAKLAALYSRYLKTLKRGAGLVPGPSETDDELLSRLRATRGEAVADVAAEFLAHYREARYRGEPGDTAAWGALVESLDARLREKL